jgi:cellulose biosynthesis protein BcsQ
MAKVISVFNHKSGVGKTTLAFHLAWKFATTGKKVLMIDTDFQCNLTELTLRANYYGSLFGFYEKNGNNNIYSALAPVFDRNDDRCIIDSFDATSVKGNDNLKLLAGHLRFVEFNVQQQIAIDGNLPQDIQNDLVASFHKLINGCSYKTSADIVIVDMSPNISAINMCLFMNSDYFILPTLSDFYCYQAIETLANVFPHWAEKTKELKAAGILPDRNPKLLGVVAQHYRMLGCATDSQKKMQTSCQMWTKQILKIVNRELADSLLAADMIIDKKKFEMCEGKNTPYHLATVPDLQSLMAISQQLSKPVFELTGKDCENNSEYLYKHGKTVEEAGSIIAETNSVYTNLVNLVTGLIS